MNINTVKCPNCGFENKNSNIKCENCGTRLNYENIYDDLQYNAFYNESLDNKSKVISLIISSILFLLILIGILFFIGIISISIISEKNESKDYLTTEATLVSHKDCEYDDNGINNCTDATVSEYEYVVDGKTYTGFPNPLVTILEFTGFREKITVKYNPNNSSEYVMDAALNRLLIPGICAFIFFVIIYIFVIKAILINSKKEKKLSDIN